MKKGLYTLFFAATAFGNLSAQELVEANSTTMENINYSHWSIMARGGISLLSYSQTPDEDYFKNRNYLPNAGLQFEYTCTPLWGWGFDFNYINNNQENYDNTIIGMGLLGSVNMSNWLAPKRKADWFNAYLNFGMGVPLTKWENATYIDEDKEIQSLKDETQISRPYIKPGISLEFTLGPSFSAGVYADAFTGLTRPSNHQNTLCIHPTENGGRVILLTGINMRYIINGSRNIRNVTPGELEKMPSVDNLQRQLDEFMVKQSRTDAMIKAASDRINALELENGKLRNQLNRLERDVKNH